MCLQGMLQAVQPCQISPDNTHPSDFKPQRAQKNEMWDLTRTQLRCGQSLSLTSDALRLVKRFGLAGVQPQAAIFGR